MKLYYFKNILLIFTCLLPLLSVAQINDRQVRVDTLSFAERLSIRTNMVDWTLLVPNIGVEFDLLSRNWNRWTVGLSLRENWQTNHTFTPGMVYNISGVKAEFRNYWRTRQVSDMLPRHKSILDRLFSCRRSTVKHPDVVYYRGLYVSYTDFSLKFGSEGRQGSAVTCGFTYGALKPLYVFRGGGSLDLELGFSVGLSYAKYDKFRHDRESDCYPVTETGRWAFVKHPVVSDIRVGFVYRIGKYPLTRKYRWRYDCDADYRHDVDSVMSVLERERMNRMFADSINKVVRDDFWHEYDSIVVANKIAADSARRAEAAQAKAERRAKGGKKDRNKVPHDVNLRPVPKTPATPTVLDTPDTFGTERKSTNVNGRKEADDEK